MVIPDLGVIAENKTCFLCQQSNIYKKRSQWSNRNCIFSKYRILVAVFSYISALSNGYAQSVWGFLLLKVSGGFSELGS